MTPHDTARPIDVAVIAPISHLSDLAVRGSIHMALTHLVLTNDGDNPYARFHTAQAAAGRTIILDNSAFELEHRTGAGMQAAAVLTAARLVHASEVVCTDVLYDGPATIAATRGFLAHSAMAGIQQPRFIGVPQGRDRDEWLACYHQLLAMPQIAVIGVSKLSVPRCWPTRADEPVTTARLACVAELHRDGPPPKPLHLLGATGHCPTSCTGTGNSATTASAATIPPSPSGTPPTTNPSTRPPAAPLTTSVPNLTLSTRG